MPSSQDSINPEHEMKFTNISIESYDQTSAFLYAIEGAILVMFNTFAVYRFLISSYHRGQRDSLLIVGCLLFDALFGVTYMSSGLYRIPFLYIYKDFPAVTKWRCVGTPALLFIIVTPTAGLFAFITTLDRFYCVMFPLKYLKRRVTYALIVMFSAYFIAIIPVVTTIMHSYPFRFISDQPITCSLGNAVTAADFIMLRVIRVVSTLSCVLIYIPIFLKMYKNIREHHLITNQGARTQKKLLRMTLTISLITSNTILFFTVPDIIMLYNPDYESNIFFIMNLNKGIVNIIIFLVTQRTLRRVILGKQGNSEIMVSVKTGGKTITCSPPKPDTPL
ncbi:hypothetical protein V3C99_017319 [Haemonchus contortus]